MEVWKVGKTFLIHCSSSMLWEMTVSNVTCMKTEYIRLKHAKWRYGPLTASVCNVINWCQMLIISYILYFSLN
ncbi:hypothetical protein LDENG_00228930 [Lucifuga dentata]|nr:hypothetical protein LDENG_00228930 [Lucifuga dentata]